MSPSSKQAITRIHLATPAEESNVRPRTWRDWFAKPTWRMSVFAATLVGCGGMFLGNSSEAKAGYILSVAQGGNDQHAIGLGVQRTIDSGDIQGWFAVDYDSPLDGQRTTVYSSAWAYTPSDISLCAHQIKPYLDFNPTFRFGTGSNYLTSPGTVYQLAGFALTPGWVNSGSNSSIADLAVGHLNGAIANFAFDKVVFADARPHPEQILNWAGYGQPGSPNAGLLSADGSIRGGTTSVSTVNPFGGASPSLYLPTKWFDDGSFLPQGMMPTQGSSGSLLRDEFGQIVAQYNRASINPNLGVAYGIDFTNVANRNFLFDNASFSAVPEPGTFTLVALALATFAYTRRRSLRWKR